MKKLLMIAACAALFNANAQNPRLFPFTNDVQTGISPHKMYTHTYNFGVGSGTTTINNVVFTNTTAHTKTDIRHGWRNFPPSSAAGNPGAIVTQSGQIRELLMSLNWDLPNNQEMVVTGLEPGTSYEVRFYNRAWTPGDNRMIRLTFKPDATTADWVQFNPDASPAVDQVLAYRYTAQDSGELAIHVARIGAGSYHVYGFSNELLYGAYDLDATGIADTYATLGAHIYTPGVTVSASVQVKLDDGDDSELAWQGALVDTLLPGTFNANGAASFTLPEGTLAPGAAYMFRFVIDNGFGELASEAEFFVTDANRVPVIENRVATSVVSGSATLNGALVLKASAADVSVLWGPTDESATGEWAFTNTVSGGPWADGAVVSFNAASLVADQEYFYTFIATNLHGSATAEGASYFIHSPLALSVAKPVFGESVSDTTEVVVSRHANCVGAPLTVYYSLYGDADADVNYSASPASGALVVEAGQTTAAITVSPIAPLNFGVAKSVVITLESGAYIVDAMNDSEELTLASIPSQNYTWQGGVSTLWSQAGNWTPAGGPPSNGGDTGLIASGIAAANATLGEPGNWPAITVRESGLINVTITPFANPLTFDGGVLATTGNNTLTGDLTLGAGGMNIGPGNYTLAGSISGEGGIVFVGSGLTFSGDTPNTYKGLTEIRAGQLRLNKQSDTTALPADVIIDGGTMVETAVRYLINPNASITVLNGWYRLHDDNLQRGAREIISNMFILGAAASASIGEGSQGDSQMTVQNQTVVSNGTLNAWGKNAYWNTRSLEVWGRDGIRSVSVGNWDGNGECGMTVGAGGLVFHQPGEGVSTLLHINAGHSGRWSNWHQHGDFTYHGNPLNTNATLTTLEGVFDNCVMQFGDAPRAFTIHPGGGLVDLVFAPRIWTGVTLNKEGEGSLVLTHTQSRNWGPINVNAGTLLVNGALVENSAVNSRATLGGTGRVNGAVNILGGTLAPGAFGPGTLTLNNNLTLAGNNGAPAKLQITLAGNNECGRLVLTNPNAVMDLQNAIIELRLADGFKPVEGTVFTIVDNQGVNPVAGSFSNLNANNNIPIGPYHFKVTVNGGDGNDITLTALPNRTLFLVR